MANNADDIFIESMGGWSSCHSCVHSNHDGSCKAFPGGIPEEIMTDDFNHTKRHPKQTGEFVYKKDNRIQL